MRVYLVGGAVRDELLNIPIKENDWVVVGENTESMLARGYKAVGKDFPVFLHPQTHEEYALARTERKTAPGYKGFIFNASEKVTLEQDLLRRDLTINAMAKDSSGHIIDPYHGQQDLQQRIFRHVSPAFSEDPVRILRVARFAARYAHLGFTLAGETRTLIHAMVASGEADHLVPERVWAELLKALQERTPAAFFYTLRECNALLTIFPEIEHLFGVPQPEKYHPEIDTGIHSLMALEQATKLSEKPEVRLAALLHDLGKALTAPENWPSHHGHEEKGLAALAQLCERLRVPNAFRSLSQIVMKHHTHCHRAFELRAAKLHDVLQQLGAFKPNNSLQEILLACEADMKGRTGFENRPYPQAQFLMTAALKARQINIKSIQQKQLQGPAIGAAIREARIKALREHAAKYQLISE